MINPSARWHSQCGEDLWVWEHFFKDGVPGTYAEVGAFDGIQSSNTLAFEDHGWEGILVEPDPLLAHQCQISRTAKTWCCACGLGRVGQLHINLGDRGLSGLTQPWEHKIMVPVMPLWLMLSTSGIEELDLLSIDTEGTEREVWQSKGEYRPRVVIIEHQTRDLPSQAEGIIMELTQLDGYKQVHRTQYNLIFTRD